MDFKVCSLPQTEGSVVASSGEVTESALIKEEDCITFKDEPIEDNCEVGSWLYLHFLVLVLKYKGHRQVGSVNWL